ncbi:phosphatidylserine/phosphatidylglycerophosphate/cardiolipin synthase-like enzyme [Pedobacter sp. W3I1]|uniref:phospholipase D-like domain-containing protein n=1 Tax=Pedobacter sp. W3I1 TaxID=3042291 RepID=UPI002785565E|nr:phospholipase D-like domain-containing protein [Pedobacter sp. W3I1]MDQ0639407.1 phosphatidylserine/phosphatidylglycerophosphate/cardiolipin synthase-like enzyme [Pedobacter sp. W3I1]
MFYNNALCDIYIGKGAGKKLMDDMNNAKHSVKIISPYLSPDLILELIYLKNKNINVKLITTNNIEDFYGDRERNIYKLIIQKRNTDFNKQIVRNKWIKFAETLSRISYGLIALLIALAYYFRDLKVFLVFVPIVVLFLIRSFYKTKIKNLQIYSYSYTQLFPFKVYMSNEKTSLIHSKIYLIDDQIAYMGSLNFTQSGTQFNHETRIRTTDAKAIEKIKLEIDELFENPYMPAVDLQLWGKQLYLEPIN